MDKNFHLFLKSFSLIIPMYIDDLDQALKESAFDLERIRKLEEKDLTLLYSKMDLLIDLFKYKIKELVEKQLEILNQERIPLLSTNKRISVQREAYQNFFLSLFNNIAATKLLERKNLLFLQLSQVIGKEMHTSSLREPSNDLLTESQNEFLKEKIVRGELQEALHELLLLTAKNISAKNEILLLNARFYELKVNNRFRLMTKEEFGVHKNRLTKSIFEFMDKITQNMS